MGGNLCPCRRRKPLPEWCFELTRGGVLSSFRAGPILGVLPAQPLRVRMCHRKIAWLLSGACSQSPLWRSEPRVRNRGVPQKLFPLRHIVMLREDDWYSPDEYRRNLRLAQRRLTVQVCDGILVWPRLLSCSANGVTLPNWAHGMLGVGCLREVGVYVDGSNGCH